MAEYTELPGVAWVTSIPITCPLHAPNHTGRYIIAKRPSINLFGIFFEIQRPRAPVVYQSLGQNLSLRQALKFLESSLMYYIERSDQHDTNSKS